MRTPEVSRVPVRRRGESGGARLNFLIVAAVIALVGYAAYNYAPVAYHAYLYKDFMQQTVNKAAYPPAQTAEWVEAQLKAGAREHGLPADVEVSAQNEAGRMAARVRWERPVPMPFFVYQYKFDHTVRSGGFINAQ
ncbi:MAG TPA: hypothetical protein VGX48_02120 [Pyrinomonadaceae bacterium]|jgi:hypothetical protein|nr:hypothetical protein [Pyrinomonadaceae bacterium]